MESLDENRLVAFFTLLVFRPCDARRSLRRRADRKTDEESSSSSESSENILVAGVDGFVFLMSGVVLRALADALERLVRSGVFGSESELGSVFLRGGVGGRGGFDFCLDFFAPSSLESDQTSAIL